MCFLIQVTVVLASLSKASNLGNMLGELVKLLRLAHQEARGRIVKGVEVKTAALQGIVVTVHNETIVFGKF